MLRASTNTLLRLTTSDVKCSNSALSLEFVRWRRKPRWLPVAKSKVFRVPERKAQDAEERAELMRLHTNYNTQIRSVRQYLREETKLKEETSTADHIVLTPEQEEAEFQRCLDENEAWNRQIATERHERLQKERQERALLIKQRLELAEERKELERERIESIVKREKEASKTFITLENLDAAIEHALANPVDYNFALDKDGNIYRGRLTVPGSSGTPATAGSAKEIPNEKLEAAN